MRYEWERNEEELRQKLSLPSFIEQQIFQQASPMMIPSAFDGLSAAWDCLSLNENLNPVCGRESKPLLDFEQLINGASIDKLSIDQLLVMQTQVLAEILERQCLSLVVL